MQYTHDPHGEVLGRAPAFTMRHWRAQRPSLEPRTSMMQANLVVVRPSLCIFITEKGVCDLRRAWFEARRPAVADLVASAVRGEHLTMSDMLFPITSGREWSREIISN